MNLLHSGLEYSECYRINHKYPSLLHGIGCRLKDHMLKNAYTCSSIVLCFLFVFYLCYNSLMAFPCFTVIWMTKFDSWLWARLSVIVESDDLIVHIFLTFGWMYICKTWNAQPLFSFCLLLLMPIFMLHILLMISAVLICWNRTNCCFFPVFFFVTR